MRAVEVQRVAPLGGVAIGEVVRRERLQVVPVGAEVVVDDVQDDAEAEGVGAIDQPPQIVGRAVDVRGRPEIDAVVAPAEASGELGDRHQLDDGDAQLAQRRQLARRGGEGSLRGERADVKLVDDLALRR